MEGIAVSVIIPAFNGEAFLAEAVSSIITQDCRSLEIIIVDDGSTDATAEVARRFGSAIQYHYQKNSGPGSARNRGVSLAKGGFLAFLDADDLWMKDKLWRQMAAFEADPELEMVFGHIQQFYSPELTEEERAGIGMPVESMRGYHAGAMLIKKEAFMQVGFFNETLKIGEFVDWYARAMEMGLKQTMLPEVLMNRRIHKTNLGISQRDHRRVYVHALKAALDRRRCG